MDFLNDPEYKGKLQKAVIDSSVLLKTFFRSMGEPVITNKLYGELVKINGRLFYLFLYSHMLRFNLSDVIIILTLSLL